MPPTFSKGNMVIAITITPIPPNHCKIALQIRISLGALSKLTIIVDPVVVIPDILSKKASINVKSRSDNINGKLPKIAILSHDREVNKKACCRFNYRISSTLVSTKSIPMNNVTNADDKNAEFFSSYII